MPDIIFLITALTFYSNKRMRVVAEVVAAAVRLKTTMATGRTLSNHTRNLKVNYHKARTKAPL